MPLSKESVRTAQQLYKYLWRICDKLPKDARSHYKHHVRQSFNSHADETDPERVEEIIQQALKDADWVLKKVGQFIVQIMMNNTAGVKDR